MGRLTHVPLTAQETERGEAPAPQATSPTGVSPQRRFLGPMDRQRMNSPMKADAHFCPGCRKWPGRNSRLEFPIESNAGPRSQMHRQIDVIVHHGVEPVYVGADPHPLGAAKRAVGAEKWCLPERAADEGAVGSEGQSCPEAPPQPRAVGEVASSRDRGHRGIGVEGRGDSSEPARRGNTAGIEAGDDVSGCRVIAGCACGGYPGSVLANHAGTKRPCYLRVIVGAAVVNDDY